MKHTYCNNWNLSWASIV